MRSAIFQGRPCKACSGFANCLACFLERRSNVEIAIVEQRPTTVSALDAPEIIADLGFTYRVHGLREIMPQQNVFRRRRGICFALEYPMSVRLLAFEQRTGRCFNACFETSRRDRFRVNEHAVRTIVFRRT